MASFAPLLFVRENPVGITGSSACTSRRYRLLQKVPAPHPYASSWWQWPTLLRPMWYTFERDAGGVERCVWAGGNPVLYWVTLPLLPLVAWLAIRRRDPAAWMLALLYGVPLLLGGLPAQAAAVLLLPAVFHVGGTGRGLAHERAQHLPPVRRARGWLLTGFVILCGLTFLYFLPIMGDGRFRSGASGVTCGSSPGSEPVARPPAADFPSPAPTLALVDSPRAAR